MPEFSDPFELLGHLAELTTKGATEDLVTSSPSRSPALSMDRHRLYEEIQRKLSSAEAPKALPNDKLMAQPDSITQRLQQIQQAIAAHPIAAKAIASALRNQGKQYIRTKEGQEFARQLANSEFIRRARLVWENASLWMLDDEESSPLPDQYIDAVFAAAQHPQFERLLDGLFRDK